MNKWVKIEVFTLWCFKWNHRGKRSVTLGIPSLNLEIIHRIRMQTLYNSIHLITNDTFDLPIAIPFRVVGRIDYKISCKFIWFNISMYFIFWILEGENYQPVICPLVCLGDCHRNRTEVGRSSTAWMIKSRGAVLGAASCVWFKTTILQGELRLPCGNCPVVHLLFSTVRCCTQLFFTLTSLTVNSYCVLGFKSWIIQLRSVAL